jgi:hypothetical protein
MTKVIDTDYLPECPCLNCICVPVCRHKSYFKLYDNCFNISLFLPNTRNFSGYAVFDKITAVKLILQPTTWDMNIDGRVIINTKRSTL